MATSTAIVLFYLPTRPKMYASMIDFTNTTLPPQPPPTRPSLPLVPQRCQTRGTICSTAHCTPGKKYSFASLNQNTYCSLYLALSTCFFCLPFPDIRDATVAIGGGGGAGGGAAAHVPYGVLFESKIGRNCSVHHRHHYNRTTVLKARISALTTPFRIARFTVQTTVTAMTESLQAG